MRIDIRSAEIADIETMTQIVNTTYSETYSPFLRKETIERFTDYDRRIEAFKAIFEKKLPIYVIIYDGVICGVLTSCIPEREPSDTIEVLQLYILSDYRKKRLGRKLLSHGLCAYRKLGYKYAVLTCFEKNENARQFYEHFGFEFRGLREADIGEGINVAMYRIEL